MLHLSRGKSHWPCHPTPTGGQPGVAPSEQRDLTEPPGHGSRADCSLTVCNILHAKIGPLPLGLSVGARATHPGGLPPLHCMPLVSGGNLQEVVQQLTIDWFLRGLFWEQQCTMERALRKVCCDHSPETSYHRWAHPPSTSQFPKLQPPQHKHKISKPVSGRLLPEPRQTILIQHQLQTPPAGSTYSKCPSQVQEARCQVIEVECPSCASLRSHPLTADYSKHVGVLYDTSGWVSSMYWRHCLSSGLILCLVFYVVFWVKWRIFSCICDLV